jgi:hypothetical protein
MERFTLRDAAHRTARSVTTLRRYIRAGRLQAEKVDGRYGPEYTVSEGDLRAAGFDVEPLPAAASREPAALIHVGDAAAREVVPSSLYHELQLKHEQLLVQYGMIRAGGLRLLEWKAEAEASREAAAREREEGEQTRQRLLREISELRKRLREAELELEGRQIELAALREKVGTLERGPRVPDSRALERQLEALSEQRRRVERLDSASRPLKPGSNPSRGGHEGH